MNNKLIKKIYIPGKHLILDFWGAKNLTDIEFIEKTLIAAANSCNATILDTKIHSFGKNSGVTGVVILSESHISIHTWPEINFCAIDVFMCGNCDAENAVEPLKRLFEPKNFQITKHIRGCRTK